MKTLLKNYQIFHQTINMCWPWWLCVIFIMILAVLKLAKYWKIISVWWSNCYYGVNLVLSTLMIYLHSNPCFRWGSSYHLTQFPHYHLSSALVRQSSIWLCGNTSLLYLAHFKAKPRPNNGDFVSKNWIIPSDLLLKSMDELLQIRSFCRTFHTYRRRKCL